jgi:hypothetical protein
MTGSSLQLLLQAEFEDLSAQAASWNLELTGD